MSAEGWDNDDRDPDAADESPDEPTTSGDGLPAEEAMPTEHEGSGLGLTEEFARIESEIHDEQGNSGVWAEEEDSGAAEEAGEAGGTEESGDPEPEPQEPGPGETVEADVIAAADAEQAAAADDAGADPEDPDDADADPEDADDAATVAGGAEAGADDADEDSAESASEEIEHTVVQRPGSRPIAARPPVTVAISEEDLENKTPSLWWRFLAGSVIIVTSIAASVAVLGLLFFEDVAANLDPIPGVKDQLTAIESDEPQTIMIVGSDKREGEPSLKGDPGRSDTTMLVRIDPDKRVLSLFSLPRDLKVFVPGVGETKLNEAYSAGGVQKTLKTVTRFTGLDINHVVEINFFGFADAVNAIGCVYVDVDRDYFNDNSTAAVGEEYSAIDINAGYQRLCGLKALQYVRYRHADSDLVRAARQQDFLREARQSVKPRELLPVFGSGNELIDIFTSYTDSDIDDGDQIIGILRSFISVIDVPVSEVHFEGDLGPSFVTSSTEQVQKAIDEFLNGSGSEGQRGGKQATEKDSEEPKPDKQEEKKPKPKPEPEANVLPTEDIPDEKLGTQAARFAKDGAKNARRLKIPVFYPTELVPGSAFDTGSRTYEYENENDEKEMAYKTVIAYTTPSTLTEYYGVMGTTWDDPPILRNPSETRTIGGRDYDFFYDGDRLRMIGWREGGNTYWLNNTLVQSVGEAEMIAIATSMKQA